MTKIFKKSVFCFFGTSKTLAKILILLEHERTYDLGTDALVTVCFWNTNGIIPNSISVGFQSLIRMGDRTFGRFFPKWAMNRKWTGNFPEMDK